MFDTDRKGLISIEDLIGISEDVYENVLTSILKLLSSLSLGIRFSSLIKHAGFLKTPSLGKLKNVGLAKEQ